MLTSLSGLSHHGLSRQGTRRHWRRMRTAARLTVGKLYPRCVLSEQRLIIPLFFYVLLTFVKQKREKKIAGTEKVSWFLWAGLTQKKTQSDVHIIIYVISSWIIHTKTETVEVRIFINSCQSAVFWKWSIGLEYIFPLLHWQTSQAACQQVRRIDELPFIKLVMISRGLSVSLDLIGWQGSSSE